MIVRQTDSLESSQRRDKGESGVSGLSTGGDYLEGGWAWSGGTLSSYRRVSVGVASHPASSAWPSLWTGVKSALGELISARPSLRTSCMFLTYLMIVDRSRVVS